MASGSVKVFQRSDSFRFLVSIFAVFMMLMVVCFLIFLPQNILITSAYFFFICAVVVGCLFMASDKVIVTSDAIVSENILKKRVIPFKTIRRVYVGYSQNTYLLAVSTTQSNIQLHGGATKKQLDEIVEYILEQIRINDPEHFQSVNLPSYEVEDFWRK